MVVVGDTEFGLVPNETVATIRPTPAAARPTTGIRRFA
jgi:hypothetical protein